MRLMFINIYIYMHRFAVQRFGDFVFMYALIHHTITDYHRFTVK